MGIGMIILTVLFVALTCGFLVVGVLSFMQKGPILTNPWALMSKEERASQMAKVGGAKPVYLQQAIAFTIFAVIMVIVTLSIAFPGVDPPMSVFWILVAGLFVYSIWSSERFYKRMESGEK